jgi:hypothetical protein
MNFRHGSSGKAPALQLQIPAFKSKSHPQKKGKITFELLNNLFKIYFVLGIIGRKMIQTISIYLKNPVSKTQTYCIPQNGGNRLCSRTQWE